MRGWCLARVIWVADRGSTSAENRRYLRKGGGHYITEITKAQRDILRMLKIDVRPASTSSHPPWSPDQHGPGAQIHALQPGQGAFPHVNRQIHPTRPLHKLRNPGLAARSKAGTSRSTAAQISSARRGGSTGPGAGGRRLPGSSGRPGDFLRVLAGGLRLRGPEARRGARGVRADLLASGIAQVQEFAFHVDEGHGGPLASGGRAGYGRAEVVDQLAGGLFCLPVAGRAAAGGRELAE